VLFMWHAGGAGRAADIDYPGWTSNGGESRGYSFGLCVVNVPGPLACTTVRAQTNNCARRVARLELGHGYGPFRSLGGDSRARPRTCEVDTERSDQV